MSLAYLNLLNSRKDKGESSDILLSYLKERNRGIFIGSIFLASTFFVLISLFIKGLFLDYQKRKYINDVIYYDKTVLKIQELKKESTKIDKENEKIINSILAIKSNLNILNELKKITPKDLFLNKLKISENSVNFEGYVNNNLGVKIINAFIIEIINSPLFLSETVILKEINYDKNSLSYEFDIKAKFNPNISELNLNMVNDNYKQGLFQRLLIMKKNKILEMK